MLRTLAIILLSLTDAPAAEREAPAARETTFETLARSATRTHDVATLLTPFVEKCDADKREIDRIRCLAAQAYLRKVLPQRSFLVSVADPEVISLSDYDAGIKGYRLGMSACLACAKPVAIGRAGERRFITLKTPQKEAGSLQKAVEISRSNLGFDSLIEAKRWLEGVRPYLRAEFLFKPVESEWTFGEGRGYALELVGGRIYNRCTGEVLVSRPPSSGEVERPPGDPDMDGCGKSSGSEATGPSGGTAKRSGTIAGASGGDDGDDEQPLPSQISMGAISDSMGKIRVQVFACYQKYQVPGNVLLTYVVSPNGMVQSIRVGGMFDGTPTGNCVREAGTNARFPRFAGPNQRFTYPFFLRGK
jgi:hypothetical protein